MRKVSLFLLLLAFSVVLKAQDDNKDVAQNNNKDVADNENWILGGTTSLMFNQTQFSNWAAGGENSIGFSSFFDVFAKYQKDKLIWDNELAMAFGALKESDNDYKKTDDKIDFSSVMGYGLKEKLYLTCFTSFKTQFTKGYRYPNDSIYISTFLAPAYFKFGLGIYYKFNQFLSFNFAPLTYKLTIVNDTILSNMGSFGVEKGEKLRHEIGANLKVLFAKEILKNTFVKSKLELFSDYTRDASAIDVNFELLLSLKINKFFNTFVKLNMIYDEDVKVLVDEKTGAKGPRTQIKEIFGIGFAYNFGSKKK